MQNGTSDGSRRPAADWVPPLLGLALAAVLGSGLWLAVNPDRAEQGVSSRQPTAGQLAAISDYFLARYWRSDPDLSKGASGCATYALGSSGGPRRMVVYTQVFCQQCPVDSGASAEIPAVFRLDGEAVVSAYVVTADGDPDFYDEIKAAFPSSLWADAHTQRVPEAGQIAGRAARDAGC